MGGFLVRPKLKIEMAPLLFFYPSNSRCPLSAGLLYLKKMNRPAEPADALRNYKAAQASTVPHLHWETNIRMGIQAAEEASKHLATGTLKWCGI
jgi:hypothetical protein